MQTRIEMQGLSIPFAHLTLPRQTAIFAPCFSCVMLNYLANKFTKHFFWKREVLSKNDKSAGWVPHLLILATLDKIQEKPPLEEIGAGPPRCLERPCISGLSHQRQVVFCTKYNTKALSNKPSGLLPSLVKKARSLMTGGKGTPLHLYVQQVFMLVLKDDRWCISNLFTLRITCQLRI